MLEWRMTLGAMVVAVAAYGCAREETSPPPIEDTVFDATVENLERARAVEDVASQRKDALDQRLRAGEE